MNPNQSHAQILHAENLNKLVKAKENEISKIRRLRLIINILKSINVGDIKLNFSTEHDEAADGMNIVRAFKILPLMEFLHLTKKVEGGNILNLTELNNINLTYLERKAIFKHFSQAAEKYLQPIKELGSTIRTDFPDLFKKPIMAPALEAAITPAMDTTIKSAIEPKISPANTTSNQLAVTDDKLEPSFDLVMDLVTKRTDDLKLLATLQNEKCAYLTSVAEHKVGPYLADEVELFHAEACYDEQKANFLRSIMVDQLTNCSEESMEAIKEISQYTKESAAKIKNTE